MKLSKVLLLTLLCVIIGVVSGIGAILFQLCLSFLNVFLMEGIVGYTDIKIIMGVRPFSLLWERPEFRRWLFPILAGLGGLVVGLIVYKFAPEASGHGTDEVIDAYHKKDGETRITASIVKMIASALTIATGGSGGKEGPIAQIGAGFGSLFCTHIKYFRKYRKRMMLAGMAAGISAIFRAPLAGSIFAAEILYSDMEYDGKALIPAAIASCVAYGVYALYYGFDPLFIIPECGYQFSLFHLLPFTAFAAISALSAFLFVKLFYFIRNLFFSINIKFWLKPAIGGVLTGIIGMYFSPALGEGSLHLQMIIDGHFPFTILFIIIILKMITTSFSIGSGGSGGIFGPSIMIGAAIGGAIGGLYNHVFPGMPVSPVVFVLMGMVSFFSGAANAPISTVILVSEMTKTFDLILPFLWVSIFGYLFSMKWNIYDKQEKKRLFFKQSNLDKVSNNKRKKRISNPSTI